MNFALLWIDALLASLLWVGALVACIARLKRKWVRVMLRCFVIAVPLVMGLVPFVFSTAALKFRLKVQNDRFAYALALLLAYLFGMILIVRRATRHEPGLAPAAVAWRRGPLTFAFLTAVVVGYMTLCNMDLAIRARCAILSVEVNTLYVATSPAIVSETQNAAPIYEKALARLAADPPKDVNNPPLGNNENFDPSEPATIAFLNRQSTTITLLRQAAAMPACRFDQDLAEPNITQMLPALNELRNAANVLNLHAREELAHGNTSSAIDDAAAIFAMSRHFGQRPLLISALVGIGMDALGNKTLQETLPAVKSRDELDGLHLEQLPSLGRMFQQALRGEERYGLTQFGNMPPGEVAPDGKPIEDTSLMSSAAGPMGAFFRVFFLDLDGYVKLMEQTQDSALQPYYQVRGQSQISQSTSGSGGIFTSILAPSLSRAMETLARGQAADACTRAAVAMTRFRLDRGTLPSRFDDLVPAYLDAVPTDPFDGKPLRLVIKNDKCIIYSVGPDQIDDGGAEMHDGRGDVIFTLTSARADATTNP